MECCSFGSCSLSWPAISYHRFHGRWFHLSVEQFEAIHYAGMTVFKLGIILFNLSRMLRCVLLDDGRYGELLDFVMLKTDVGLIR